MNRLISRTLSTTKSRLALIEKDAIIHVSWNTPSKKIGVAHSKYGEVIVKEVQAVENNSRVAQTQFIFLKASSERVGSDMERLWILNDNSYLYQLKND